MRRVRKADTPPPPIPDETSTGVNDRYVDAYPSDGEGVALFAESWASKLPLDGVASGVSPLFEDARIAWLLDGAGPLDGLDILELGPLEGGHTRMALERGAAGVTAIEANSHAFLRCLVVKNLFGLDRARFLLGNFERYLAGRPRRYDLILASGVLYHLADPLKVLQDMVAMSDRICIWSHFFDRERIRLAYRVIMPFTGGSRRRAIGGDEMTYYDYSYGPSFKSTVFRGGVNPTCVWLDRGETVAFFERHGYRVTIGLQQDESDNGPHCCLLALR